MDKSCLIITDVQNDFCPGGTLAVNQADEIISTINKISGKFYKVVATQDWHPIGHVSFASTYEKKIGDTIEVNGQKQVLWPDHCIQNSKGADFHEYLNLNPVDIIVKKGKKLNMDSYSAFFENDHKTETGLHYFLNGFKIKDVYLCGLTTDYCVFYSTIDAKNLGFNVFVILDATKGVDYPEGNVTIAINEMGKNGIKIINHTDL